MLLYYDNARLARLRHRQHTMLIMSQWESHRFFHTSPIIFPSSSPSLSLLLSHFRGTQTHFATHCDFAKYILIPHSGSLAATTTTTCRLQQYTQPGKNHYAWYANISIVCLLARIGAWRLLLRWFAGYCWLLAVLQQPSPYHHQHHNHHQHRCRQYAFAGNRTWPKLAHCVVLIALRNCREHRGAPFCLCVL